MSLPESFKGLLLILIAIIISTPCLAQEQTQKNPITTANAGAVYFVRNNNIWLFDLKSNQEHQITNDKKITSYCVSFDGRLLAYFADAEIIYLYDLVANKETFMAQIKTDLTNPSFSPKGDRIALIGYSAATRHVWLLDIKTKKLTDLTPDSEYHHMFATWSPDGKWISYTSFVNPWWTFFKDTDWEVYILDVFDSNHASYKIGKGTQSQWTDKNTVIVARDKLLGVYNVQSKSLLKEYWIDDSNGFGYFTIGKPGETLFYASYNGGEGEKSKVKVFDLKSRRKSEIIFDAENPAYVKASQ